MILNPFTTIPSIPLNACLIEWRQKPIGKKVPGFKFYGPGMEINSGSICIKEDTQRTEWLEQKAKEMERWNAENPKQPPDEKHHPLQDLLVEAVQFGSGK